MPYCQPPAILKLLEEYAMPQVTDSTNDTLVALHIMQRVNVC